MRLAVICCFQDEQELLPRLLASMAAQQRRPDRLLLVDDGSRDESGRLADEFAAEHVWADVLHLPQRPPDPDRLARAAELLAFQAGMERLEPDWDVVAKFDGDLELTPLTIATVVEALEAEPRLGIAGPYLSIRRPDGSARREPHPPEHVRGSNKFYRRRCYEQIAPLPAYLGWDGLDELRARLHGWATRSIAIPDGDPIHLRPTGLHGGARRAWRRWGECAWGSGVGPLQAPLNAVVTAKRQSRPLAALDFLVGYYLAAIRRRPRVEREVRALRRAETRSRLAAALRRR
jgi:hypothetical protein